MNEQNFKNHGRYIPLYHFITPAILLAIFGGSIVNLINADVDTRYSAALILFMPFVLFIIYWYSRSFALRAQDRAIRAEENFRHFILTWACVVIRLSGDRPEPSTILTSFSSIPFSFQNFFTITTPLSVEPNPFFS